MNHPARQKRARHTRQASHPGIIHAVASNATLDAFVKRTTRARSRRLTRPHRKLVP